MPVASSSREWESIPEDVLRWVFARLPLATHATLRCVSKQWRSVVRSKELQDLRSSFLTSRKPWFVFLAAKNSIPWKSYWLAGFDPADGKWYRLPLKLGESNRTRTLVAMAGSTLCFVEVNRKVFQASRVWVSNPFTGFKRQIPPPPSRFFSHETDDAEDLRERFQALVINPATEGFKILVEGFYRTLDTYDSILNSWSTTSMDLPSCIESTISRPFLNGFLYCLAKHPTRLVTYDVNARLWKNSEATIDSSIQFPSLLQHREEVLMVAGMSIGGRGNFDEDAAAIMRIGIWKLTMLESVWEAVVFMPAELQVSFLKKNEGNSLHFVGGGDVVYFSSMPSSSNKNLSETLAYDLSEQRWFWLPQCFLTSKKGLIGRKRASPPVRKSTFGLPNMLACEASLVDDPALLSISIC